VLDRAEEALATTRTALELAPTSDAAFTAEAQAHLQLSHWADAERAARIVPANTRSAVVAALVHGARR
jgi:hypothetical protein